MRRWRSTDRGGGVASDVPDGLGLDVLGAWVGASRDAILVLDDALRMVYVSPGYCALLGWEPDRMLGRNALSFVPERNRPTVWTHWENVREGRSEPLRAIALRADGSELEIEVTGTPVDLSGRQFCVFVVRDLTESQQQARRAAALAQAAASVAASVSIDAVLEAISECALAGTRALAAWVTLDGEDHVGPWVGAAGAPDEFRRHLRAGPPPRVCSMIQEALTAGRVAVYADWRQQAERAYGGPCPLGSLPWQPAALVRLLHRGVDVGLLTAIYREGEMPYAAETTFLAALADQAATAAANAQLLAAAREKVALEERQRLARELHDSVSQSLYGIQLGVQMARERLDRDPAGIAQPIDYVMRLAEAGQAEMRALIFELRPESLEKEGLVAALNRQIEAVRARHGIAAPTVLSAEPDLSVEVKHTLHRIAQEALWNTVRHARARRVDVHLEADGDSVVLEIADDGVGFDPNASFPGHLGLRSMHERAARVGGLLEVISIRGRGTRILVRVPSAPRSPSRGERTSRSLPRPARRAA